MRTGTSAETEWTRELQTEIKILGLAGESTVIKAQDIFHLNMNVSDKDSQVTLLVLTNKGGTANINLSPLTG